jgi:hypothetical protein
METKRKIAIIASLLGLAIAAGLWFWNRPAPAVAVIPAAPPVAATLSVAAPSSRQQKNTIQSPASPVLRPPPPTQSPLVSKLLSPDSAVRIATLRAFTRHLSTNDVATLVAFLENHPGDYAGLRPIEYNAIRNDVLNVLQKQDKPVAGLGARVAAMSLDRAHDDIWRDYCIQFLADFYEAAPAVTSPDSERDRITTAYWDAAAQAGKSFAGTALIGLEALSQKCPELDREKVGLVAVALAGDENTCEASRITALRLCGKMKRAEALEPARIVAQTGITISLRMAAIATIGDLGELQDLEYLQGTSAHESPRLKPVLEAAVKAIRTRLGTTKG